MVQTVRQTWDFPVTVHDGRCLRCACHAGSLPSRDAEAVSHGQACLADPRDFAVAARAGGLCSCCSGRASLVKLAQDLLVGPCTQVHGLGGVAGTPGACSPGVLPPN